MAFHRFLRAGGSTTAPVERPATPSGETEVVRRIVARLEALPREQARLLASTAYILARAANADLHISEVETRAMERELAEGGLEDAQAVLVVEMAKLQELTTGETSDYLVTREFKETTTAEQRVALLRACYHIAVADDSISAMESATLNQIASELDIPREDAAAVRSEFADKLSARGGFGQA